MQRILVVDDDDLFRASVRRGLREAGYTVTDTANGMAVFGRLDDALVDVVVLDVQSPGLNGLEVMREIKLLWPAVKIIATCGHYGDAERYLEISQNLGAAAVLEKPFTIQQLIGGWGASGEAKQPSATKVKPRVPTDGAGPIRSASEVVSWQPDRPTRVGLGQHRARSGCNLPFRGAGTAFATRTENHNADNTKNQ
jgi:two-component system, response regulator, stage 0 sporulation protein F